MDAGEDRRRRQAGAGRTLHGGGDAPPAGVPRWLAVGAALSWRGLVLAAAVAVATWVLVRLSLATASVVIALFLATVAVPVSNALEKRGLSRALAATVTVVGGTLLLLALIGGAVPLFVSQLSDIGEQLQQARQTTLELMRDGPLALSADQLDRLVQRAIDRASENSGRLVAGALGGVLILGEILAVAVLSLIILFFLVKDGEEMNAWALDKLPDAHRDTVRRVSTRAWETLGGYMRGIALVAFVDAAAVGIGLLIIGVPLAAPLVLLTFFSAFVPIVGAVTAGSVAALVALVTGGAVDFLLVVALYIAVQQLEGNLLQPVVMGKVVHLHPVVVLVALTAGATVAGIAGAFLAVPVAAVLAAVGHEIRTGSSTEVAAAAAVADR